MITFLYIYFVLNLITGIVFYFTARNSRISNEFVDWVQAITFSIWKAILIPKCQEVHKWAKAYLKMLH